jgi:Na+:H+ antiporter, NhaC family
VLGVPTGSYLPFCFFNILSPILDVLYGFVGFKVPTIAEGEPPSTDAGDGAPAAEPAPG